MKETKESKKPVELTDEEMEKVNGGMEIVLTDYPKFLRPFLRFFFKVKEPAKSDTNNTDTK